MPPPGTSEHIRYCEFPVGASPVAVYASGYWQVVVSDTYPAGEPHPIWPDGCVSLSARAAGRPVGTRVVGPRTMALRVPLQPGDTIWGIRFWPDAGGRALGVAARTLRDRAGLADEWLGERGGDLVRALSPHDTPAAAAGAFDHWLGRLLRDAAPIDALVRRAVDMLIASNGCAAVRAIADTLEISPRQLQRRFGDAVGLTPKQFARIRRMRAALAKLLESPRERWAAIAAELQYADQAHLVRDVANLTGLTPTILARRMDRIAHVGVKP